MKAADRQQVRKPAPAHGLGVFLGDRPLIARRKSAGDTARRARQAFANVATEPFAEGVQAARCRWVDNFDVPQSTADRAKPLEPGVSGKVVRSGECHRWRRR